MVLKGVAVEATGFTDEELEDITLCLNTLLSIRAGEQPLDRDLGIDFEEIDGQPMAIAMNTLSVEIIEKVEAYEPRVEVESVDFETDPDSGQIRPHIHIVKNDDYEDDLADIEEDDWLADTYNLEDDDDEDDDEDEYDLWGEGDDNDDDEDDEEDDEEDESEE